MDYTQEQLDAFKTEFARKRRNQLILAAPIVLLVVGSAFFEPQLKEALADTAPWIPAAVLIPAVLGALGFSFRNWRCPACDKYLGKSASIAFCAKCGVALK